MYLITGARGQLGTALREVMPHAAALGSGELDIGDAGAVAEYVTKHRIRLIINCAAYTAVDKAEDEAGLAERANAAGPGNLARSGAGVVHISTDYVFDGASGVPYVEDAPTNPMSVYGRTKLAGEREVLAHAPVAVVIRTGWLYSSFGTNFVKTMLRLGAEREVVRVVADQTGTPTSALDLAQAIAAIVPRLKPELNGIYHYSNAGSCSWHGFAEEIMRLAGLSCRVVPIESAEYPTRATRPSYSVLDKTKFMETFGLRIPHWKESLQECLKRF